MPGPSPTAANFQHWAGVLRPPPLDDFQTIIMSTAAKMESTAAQAARVVGSSIARRKHQVADVLNQQTK